MTLCCHLQRNVGFFSTGMYMKYGFCGKCLFNLLTAFFRFLMLETIGNSMQTCFFFFFPNKIIQELINFPLWLMFSASSCIYIASSLYVYIAYRKYIWKKGDDSIKLNVRKLSLLQRLKRFCSTRLAKEKGGFWWVFFLSLFVCPFYPLHFQQPSVTFKCC